MTDTPLSFEEIQRRSGEMPDFRAFASSLSHHFDKLANSDAYTLVRSNIDRDALWESYLDAYAPEDNPVFRKRRWYDCSNDRLFVKRIGSLIAIRNEDAAITTVWDIPKAEIDPVFKSVAKKMNKLVLESGIASAFVMKDNLAKVSTDHTFEPIPGSNEAIEWDHFHAYVPPKYTSAQPDDERGRKDSIAGVIKRSLDTITVASLEDVLEMIASDALYRGQEFRSRVQHFLEEKREYDEGLPETTRTAIAYALPPTYAIRNTVIGTLLVDLSEGVDVEKAVASYETKVAPHNYKRPKPVITEGMKKEALKTIVALGIQDSLERRQAKLSDISVTDVLWTDADARKSMKPSKLDSLLSSAVKTTSKKREIGDGQAIDLGTFLKDVVPSASSMAIHMDNELIKHLVTLTAPVHPEAPGLFKWDNNFSWSYNGDLADSSIAETVRKYGGKTAGGKLRVSLAWHNADDLDLHCHTPDSDHLYFGRRMGVLDLDMNGTDKHSSTDPVENMIFSDLQDGVYVFHVHQYQKRTMENPGFILEVEAAGSIWKFTYDPPVKNRAEVGRLLVSVKGGQVVSVAPDTGSGLTGGDTQQDVWGVETKTFVPVSTLMFSPNFWGDNEAGNQHLFFMLKGCRNPDSVRGIYNEYLRPEIEKHRRVFEVLGKMTKAPYTDDQLSGVGFSLSGKTSIKVKADGKLYTVTL